MTLLPFQRVPYRKGIPSGLFPPVVSDGCCATPICLGTTPLTSSDWQQAPLPSVLSTKKEERTVDWACWRTNSTPREKGRMDVDSQRTPLQDKSINQNEPCVGTPKSMEKKSEKEEGHVESRSSSEDGQEHPSQGDTNPNQTQNKTRAKGKRELKKEKQKAKLALKKEQRNGNMLRKSLEKAQIESDRIKEQIQQEYEKNTDVEPDSQQTWDVESSIKNNANSTTDQKNMSLNHASEGDAKRTQEKLVQDLKQQLKINRDLKKDKDSLYRKLKDALDAMLDSKRDHQKAEEALREQVQQLNDQVEQAEKNKAELFEKIKGKAAEIDDLRAHLVQLQAANEVHKDTIDNLQGDLDQKEVLVREVTCLSEERLQTIHLLEETLKNHTEEIEHWRGQVVSQSHKNKDNKRILHLVGLILIPLKASLLLLHAVKHKKSS